MKSKPSPIIELVDISKTYSDKNEKVRVEALKHIHLNFYPNHIYAIMGKSGSGKSTLMHILGLLDDPTSGQYYLEGSNAAHLSDKEKAVLRNRHIGFVFQTFNLLPRYSIYKNVELPMLYNETPEEMRKEKIESLLDKVGLSGRAHHKPSELSGGERQRVAIARALTNDPSLVLADEPTGNLDSKTEKEIMDLFKSLKDETRTIILVTHDQSVASYADTVVVIQDGELAK
jgi:putative ABC transport system ATP-binding protein